jgi:hypothetical protein
MRYIGGYYDGLDLIITKNLIKVCSGLDKGKVFLLYAQQLFIKVTDVLQAAPVRGSEIADKVFPPVARADYGDSQCVVIHNLNLTSFVSNGGDIMLIWAFAVKYYSRR